MIVSSKQKEAFLKAQKLEGRYDSIEHAGEHMNKKAKEQFKPTIFPVKRKAKPSLSQKILHKIINEGGLTSLSEIEKRHYYVWFCNKAGLDPASRPFEYINFKNKKGADEVVLYAKKEAAEQLRKLHSISISIVDKRVIDNVYLVTVRATLPNGRFDESTGAVELAPSYSLERTNVFMFCETKAKRRATLSICGIGVSDELDIIPQFSGKQANDAVAPKVTVRQDPVNMKDVHFTLYKASLLEAQDIKELKKVFSEGWARLHDVNAKDEAIELLGLFEQQEKMFKTPKTLEKATKRRA